MASARYAIKPSSRALANLESGAFIDLENEASKLPQYDPGSCPDGLIDLSGAINGLMDDFLGEEMDEFSKSYNFHQELAEAVSTFVNRKFNPALPVNADDILVTNGVTSLIDLMAFGICEPGEGIMALTPTYMMFPHDVCARTGVRLIPVHLDNMDDQFDASCSSKLIQAMEKVHSTASKSGTNPKALLLCNPNNPCGRTYPRSTLVDIARFCGRRGMHLLSDEIYAMSTFSRSEPFTSVLSIPDDPARGVFAENVHCMYGASKDFGCGGLRLGFLVTRNELLWKSVRRLALFTWVSSFPAAFFTHFLRREDAVERYLSTYRERLAKRYAVTAELLREREIPVGPANGGIFVFVRLAKWLVYFGHPSKADGSREMQLCRYLLNEAGVFLSPGELSLSSVPGCFRLVYTGNAEHVSLAIGRLGKALQDLEQQRKPSALERNSQEDCSSIEEEKGISVERRPRRSIARFFLCGNSQ
ncbi:hypothetical protein CPLU01_00300 [Colletotrichum plurivorum]|uniref:Aminotransferase class I/classII large domain-containing protein n=1 Tax=Colletotrichum plurivorum TaxID=2175906 RepID=A0A8H6NSB1_9PEZI|nr:hypothetical protein CPLU01_00300 [Colletotrichum plurivorum]